jgi:hypothetical protein
LRSSSRLQVGTGADAPPNRVMVQLQRTLNQ